MPVAYTLLGRTLWYDNQRIHIIAPPCGGVSHVESVRFSSTAGNAWNEIGGCVFIAQGVIRKRFPPPAPLYPHLPLSFAIDVCISRVYPNSRRYMIPSLTKGEKTRHHFFTTLSSVILPLIFSTPSAANSGTGSSRSIGPSRSTNEDSRKFSPSFSLPLATLSWHYCWTSSLGGCPNTTIDHHKNDRWASCPL